MIIIDILRMDINIKGIKWIIHIEEIWGYIPFIQELEWNERKDGIFNSYIILSNEIKNRLEIRDRRSMISD